MGRKVGYSVYIPILFTFINIVLCIAAYFSYESEIKLLILVLFLLISILVYLRSKDSVLSSIVGLLIALPFNIVFIIPGLQENSFVSGIYVNYLSPVLSIVDIFVLQLALMLLIVTKRFKKIDIKWFALIVVLGTTQLLIQQDANVVAYNIRLLIYIFTGLLLFEHIKLIKKIFTKNLKFVSLVLFMLVLAQVLIGYLQVKNGNSLGLAMLGESAVSAGNVDSSSVAIEGDLYLRAYGTFPHPNVLAGWLLLIYISTLSLFKKKGLIHKVIILLTVIGIALTLSQSAIIAMIVVTVIYLFFRRKETAANGILAFVIPEKESITERVDLLRSSFEYLKDDLLFGVGGGNFTRNFYQYAPLDVGGLTLMQPVHNIFVLFLIEYGVLGVIVITISTFMMFKGNKFQFMNKLAVSCFVVIVLIGSIDHYLLTLPQGLVILGALILLILYSSYVDKTS